jgi:polyisoprenoid-binding protein YceI
MNAHIKQLAWLALASPLLANAAAKTYDVDPVHSFPYFSVQHFGMSTVSGRFDKMSGKISFDAADKTGSIDIRIPTASVSTGDGKRADGARSRDEHLRSPDFFNSVEFPEMVYTSTKLHFTGEVLTSVDGNLTLLGVTKPVKLSVTSFKCGPNPFNKRPMCGVDANTSIKRSDFGMKFGIPTAVGDEVKIWVNVEAYTQ